MLFLMVFLTYLSYSQEIRFRNDTIYIDGDNVAYVSDVKILKHRKKLVEANIYLFIKNVDKEDVENIIYNGVCNIRLLDSLCNTNTEYYLTFNYRYDSISEELIKLKKREETISIILTAGVLSSSVLSINNFKPLITIAPVLISVGVITYLTIKNKRNDREIN